MESMESIHEIIEREFSCDHADSPLRVKTSSNNVRHYYPQCQRCGAMGQAKSRAKITLAELRQMLPWDDDLPRRWRLARDARWKELSDAAREAEWAARHSATAKRKAECRERYHRPDWQEIRRKVFKRAGGICEGCLSAPAAQCRHLTYDNLGHEFMFELLALCRRCHEKVHGIEPEETAVWDVKAVNW